MQSKLVVVIAFTAFCCGAGVVRLYDKWTLTETGLRFSETVPYQKAPASADVGPAPSGTQESARYEGEGFNYENCMAGARRRGVTEEQAKHACDEIMQ